MAPLKIDIKNFTKTHKHYEHICGYASGALFYFPCLKAVYHSAGYLITENICNAFQFSEFCNAFEIGSEVYANHFRVKKILRIV